MCNSVRDLDLGRKLSKIIAIQICIAEFLFFIILEYELDLVAFRNGNIMATKTASNLLVEIGY